MYHLLLKSPHIIPYILESRILVGKVRLYKTYALLFDHHTPLRWCKVKYAALRCVRHNWFDPQTNQRKDSMIGFDLIYCVSRHFQKYFSYIMATSFSGGRSRRESLTMGKQLVNFITCGCESSAPFL